MFSSAFVCLFARRFTRNYLTDFHKVLEFRNNHEPQKKPLDYGGTPDHVMFFRFR